MPESDAQQAAEAPVKSEVQLAVEAFDTADAAYRRYEQLLTTGTIMSALLTDRKEALTPDRAVLEFNMFMDTLKSLLEDRNAKLKVVKDALRQAVVLAPTQWRGADGRATSLVHGNFRVNSVTSRTFDAKDLLGLLESKYPDKLQELLTREKLDKNGKRYHLVQQVYEVDYEGVLAFLKAYNLMDVLESAYEETEKTPMVNGPKLLAFIGDEVKSG